jgi:hypothetical protein
MIGPKDKALLYRGVNTYIKATNNVGEVFR